MWVIVETSRDKGYTQVFGSFDSMEEADKVNPKNTLSTTYSVMEVQDTSKMLILEHEDEDLEIPYDEMNDEEQLMAIFGLEDSDEIFPLTHEQVYKGMKEQVEGYFSMPGATENDFDRWRKDLEDIETWYKSVTV